MNSLVKKFSPFKVYHDPQKDIWEVVLENSNNLYDFCVVYSTDSMEDANNIHESLTVLIQKNLSNYIETIKQDIINTELGRDE